MAKPIFIVEVPMMLHPEEFLNTQKLLERQITDYHVLMVKTNVDDYKFKVFYEKDFTEINFDELKKLIKDKL